MKIHVRAFALSFTIIFALLILLLSVWSRLSLTFGNAFMEAFTSIHPNPYAVMRPDLSLGQNAIGVAFDVFYAVVDSLVFSLSFTFLYNKFVPDSREADAEQD